MGVIKDIILPSGQAISDAYHRIETIAVRDGHVFYTVLGFTSKAEAEMPLTVRRVLTEHTFLVARPHPNLDPILAQMGLMLLAGALSEDQRNHEDGTPRDWQVTAWTGGMQAIECLATSEGAALPFRLHPATSGPQVLAATEALRGALLQMLYPDLLARDGWQSAVGDN